MIVLFSYDSLIVIVVGSCLKTWIAVLTAIRDAGCEATQSNQGFYQRSQITLINLLSFSFWEPGF